MTRHKAYYLAPSKKDREQGSICLAETAPECPVKQNTLSVLNDLEMKNRCNAWGLILAFLVVFLLPSSSRGAVFSIPMEGIVEEVFFGAEERFPLGSQLDFMVAYETDPVLNPDSSPDPNLGFYELQLWALVGFGASNGGLFSGIIVTNGANDSLSFSLGSTHLPGLTIPSRGMASFSHNFSDLRFNDPSGTILDSDTLPTGISPVDWGTGTFLMRWGGADGPAIRGSLRIVPEPRIGGLLLLTFLASQMFTRRGRI